MQNVTFVTGSDTGVGKTLVTALMLQHLRSSGINALGIKPFCTGARDDVELISSVQGDVLPRRLVNPFFAPKPVAPLLAFRRRRHPISLDSAMRHVRSIAAQCEELIIEGCGGLWVPLAEDFFILDLIQCLQCKVVLVVSNRLGAISQTLLCVSSLEVARLKQVKVVLNSLTAQTHVARSNFTLLRFMLGRYTVERLPFMGHQRETVAAIRKNALSARKTLARICAPNTVYSAFLANRKRNRRESLRKSKIAVDDRLEITRLSAAKGTVERIPPGV